MKSTGKTRLGAPGLQKVNGQSQSQWSTIVAVNNHVGRMTSANC